MATILGLTGGIASGKSTVSEMLSKKGYTVIDADLAARKVVEVGQPAYLAIVEEFGRSILHKEDDTINRAKLGDIVFHNEEMRKKLNGIVHPAVRGLMLSEKDQAIESGKITIIMDIPLLYESDLTWMVDRTIVVYVDEETQLSRLMKRNQFTEQEAASRIASQFPLEDKIGLADAVINNNGTIEQTEEQLEKIINEWDLRP
ncbi:dephospho-CoA kinase [[Bacillus] enclensis]|uniref:Dephospho-CoA kinase n=1 Tax=[Bacillus] enclensis TaxID=1402860 RepID=A0A0V8HP68_9BACI|nr:dephospho-CoA kinase [[Bacillus] enclensis]KSU63953.1 dephospho-CoA kinase [[Bacillus] enclensis]OAT84488.1 dephospho-CoA kinase [Bacillus sp. MKU004]SCB92237.1 dephospho-CoA kinase [[Bacillus] enclensis]